MKYAAIVFLTIIFSVQLMHGQSTDSTAAKEKKEKKQEQVEKQKSGSDDKGEKVGDNSGDQSSGEKLEGFVDNNGNGIDDRLEAGKGGKRKMKGQKGNKDRFIDADGDGICDGNESAIGLRKIYRKRHGRGGGK